MDEKQLPLIGAAMMVKMLATHIDWILEDQRDLEIQDPIYTAMFDNDWDHLRGLSTSEAVTVAGWREIAQQANALLDGYKGRLGIHGPFFGTPVLTIDRKIRNVMRERLHQSLDFAQEIGATQMVLHSPWDTFGRAFVPYARPQERQLITALVMDLLSDVLPAAEAAHCVIVFEGIFDRNPAPLLEMIRAFDSEFVQLSIDTGHAYINYCLGGPPPDQWVRDGGALLAHMHIQDGDGNSDRHWAPGRGNINWYALFEAIQELDHCPRLLLETSQLRDGAAWLITEGYVR